ncbi:MerR family transcriptional regulator [Enterococcus faecalis]|nr:MerR family transcriptional regulator [Enterococcus faecalis]
MKIKEFSQLYNITPHSLRFYEKIGLLIPNYLENGYREYTYKHIEAMNIIRDLRYFDIPLSEIEVFIKMKSLANAKELLQLEIKYSNKQINKLMKKNELLLERLENISSAELIDKNVYEIQYYPTRHIIKSDSYFDIKKTDYELKVLHQTFSKSLHSHNQYIFGTIELDRKCSKKYKAFYFCNDKSSVESNQCDILKSGYYLSYLFNGGYDQVNKKIKQMKQHITKNKIDCYSNFYITYLIDFHETRFEEEYTTKIEVLVEDINLDK